MDGRKLDSAEMDRRGIVMLPDFREPYHGRALTFGEIGCFLSHHDGVWADMVHREHAAAIVFEDDIRFEPHFRSRLGEVRDELQRVAPDWELVFLGRKILHDVNEPWVGLY